MRCTGHCCDRFTINLADLTDPDLEIVDGDYIRDMAILQEEVDERRWVVTCRHFDGTNCLEYDSRPQMCSRYPYGKSCARDGCTLV